MPLKVREIETRVVSKIGTPKTMMGINQVELWLSARGVYMIAIALNKNPKVWAPESPKKVFAGERLK